MTNIKPNITLVTYACAMAALIALLAGAPPLIPATLDVIVAVLSAYQLERTVEADPRDAGGPFKTSGGSL